MRCRFSIAGPGCCRPASSENGAWSLRAHCCAVRRRDSGSAESLAFRAARVLSSERYLEAVAGRCGRIDWTDRACVCARSHPAAKAHSGQSRSAGAPGRGGSARSFDRCYPRGLLAGGPFHFQSRPRCIAGDADRPRRALDWHASAGLATLARSFYSAIDGRNCRRGYGDSGGVIVLLLPSSAYRGSRRSTSSR